MPFITAQQSAQYYEKYSGIQVTLTKDVIRVTGIQPSEVFMKCGGDQCPCIIYSTSMKDSKLIMKLDLNMIERIKEASNVASLRFCFKEKEKGKHLSFYVPGKIAGYSKYNAEGKNDFYIVNFEFSKKPADDLIGIFGHLLDVNISSKKRSEVRLEVDSALLKDLGMFSKSVKLEIEQIPRMGVLKDISFSGARIIISGIAKFLMNKTVSLNLKVEDFDKPIKVSGVIKHCADVEGRKDLTIIGVKFDDDKIPMSFKTKINDAINKRGI